MRILTYVAIVTLLNSCTFAQKTDTVSREIGTFTCWI
jgi:hypothetical protein